MVKFLFLGQFITFLNFIEELCHLIDLQTDNFLFVELRHAHEGGGVLIDPLISEEIAVEAAERRDLPHESTFCIYNIFICITRMTFQIINIFLQICHRQLFKIRRCESMGRIVKGAGIGGL